MTNIVTTACQSNPRSDKRDANWKFEQQSESSVLGGKFAEAIAAVAVGRFDDLPQVKKSKEIPAFKKIYWDEPRHNPAMANTHICYEYDAHAKEEQSHWTKSGVKFSGEPRLAKLYTGYGGPSIPDNFPTLFEKPVKVYGRTREERPFETAHKYNKPVERPVYRPKYIDQAQLRTYILPDPWKDTSKPVCGVVKPTSAFQSKTERFAPSIVSSIKSSMNSTALEEFSIISPSESPLHSRSNSPSRGNSRSNNDSRGRSRNSRGGNGEHSVSLYERNDRNHATSPPLYNQNMSLLTSSITDGGQSQSCMLTDLAGSQSTFGQQQSGIMYNNSCHSSMFNLNTDSTEVIQSSSYPTQQGRPQTTPNFSNSLDSFNHSSVSQLRSHNPHAALQCVPLAPNNNSIVSYSPPKSAPQKLLASALRHQDSTRKLKKLRDSKSPGFSFRNGTPPLIYCQSHTLIGSGGKSCFDTDNEYGRSVSYRRIQVVSDGSCVILPVETTSGTDNSTDFIQLPTARVNSHPNASRNQHTDHTDIPRAKTADSHSKLKSSSSSTVITSHLGVIKYSPTWAQTQFFAEHDSSLVLSATPLETPHGRKTSNKSATSNNSKGPLPNNVGTSGGTKKRLVPNIDTLDISDIRSTGELSRQSQLATPVNVPYIDDASDVGSNAHSMKLNSTTYTKQLIGNWKPPVFYSKDSVKNNNLLHKSTFDHSVSLPSTAAVTGTGLGQKALGSDIKVRSLSASKRNVEDIIPVNKLNLKGKPNVHLYEAPGIYNATQHALQQQQIHQHLYRQQQKQQQHQKGHYHAGNHRIPQQHVPPQGLSTNSMSTGGSSNSILQQQHRFVDGNYNLNDDSVYTGPFNMSRTSTAPDDQDILYATSKSQSILNMLEYKG